MKRARATGRRWILSFAFAAAACGGGEEVPSESPERASFQFTGTVEAVDTVADRVTVHNDDIPGWMAPMSMSYAATPADAVARLQVGARVRATVYEGDFTTLHEIEAVPQ
jgi:Cu/Ag efflux protein CusF